MNEKAWSRTGWFLIGWVACSAALLWGFVYSFRLGAVVVPGIVPGRDDELIRQWAWSAWVASSMAGFFAAFGASIIWSIMVLVGLAMAALFRVLVRWFRWFVLSALDQPYGS